MATSQWQKYQAIKEAMNIIAPSHIAEGGAEEIVRDYIVVLIDRVGSEKALKKIEQTKRHHRAQLWQIVM